MKQPFRYFRGEFNGAYLYHLVTCPNFAVQDILDELVYNMLFQWKLEDEISSGEMAIRFKDVVNIAIIAGLFQQNSYGRVSIGSVYFSPSHIVNKQERSERGLINMETEGFRFVRTEYDDYPDDIVNEASEQFRQALVPEGTEPVGYVPLGVPLYTNEGEVIWDNLLPTPPTDGTPYTTYYGEKFIVHEEYFYKETPLPIEVLKLLLECMQRIRYNGPTITRFMEITQILGEGYIYDIEIVYIDAYYLVGYKINESSDIMYRDRRYAAWLNICAKKFKLFILENRS